MRTLKKTLALVLVLAMMFSLCITASADFTDADEITYTEAVEVLAMIGVIEGMPDGSYGAKEGLTRAQAATIITRLLGAEDYAIATKGEFADVPASHWAAGAISFCVEAGIVSGYGDGNFGPEDALTGYQWAKMLLCALGYNADSENMNGAAWQINVAKLAKAEGLFTGNLKADKTVAATREEAALYAFNLLPATIVEYKGGSSVTVGDITFTSGGELKDTGVPFMAEYFANLSCQDGAGFDADAFGRPGYTWVLTGLKPADTKTVWVGEEAMATYEGLEWNANEVAALKKALYNFDNAQVIYNGYNWAGNNSADFYNDLGVTVELYADIYGNITEIVAYEPYAAKITDVKTDKTGKTTVTMDVYEAGYYLSNSKTYKTITIDSVANKYDYAVVAGLAKNDIFVGYFAQEWETSKDIIAVDSFETVTGKVTAISADEYYNGWVKIDGEQYYFANEYSQAAVAAKSEGTFYLYNGYVMHFVKTADAAPQYAYVLAMDDETTDTLFGTETTVWYAKLLLADGTVVTVPTTEVNGTIAGNIVAYADGTGDNAGKTVLSATGLENADTTDKAYDLQENVASQKGAIFNNNSVVIVETLAADGKTPVYTVYTGVTNIPELLADDVAGVVKNGVWTLFYAIGAELVEEDVASTDVAYVVGCGDKIVEVIDNKNVEYYVYTAIVNGEITTFKAIPDSLAGYYGGFVYNANDMVTAGAELKGTGLVITNDVEATVAKDGVIAGYIYDDATVVYAVDATTGVVTESTISAIEAEEVMDVYTTNGILTMVVFVDAE